MQDLCRTARDGSISAQENILLWHLLQIHLCSQGYFLFMQLIGTCLYTSAAAFTSITHSWSSIDALCWDQRTRSLNQLFTTSTSPQFHSIPYKSDFTDPTGKCFSNKIHGTLVRKHSPITENRRGNLILLISPHTTEFLFLGGNRLRF